MSAAGLCPELAICWLLHLHQRKKIPKNNELNGTGLAALALER
jgi:hypothetical protein